MEQNFKCSVCGATMEFQEDQGIIICPYCGEIITYEKEPEVIDNTVEDYHYNRHTPEYQYNNKAEKSGGNTFASAAGGAMIGVIVVIVILYFAFMELMSNL